MEKKIYTKTGDKGTTSLIGGTKVPKSHVRIEAYGTVDELNSFIGLVKDLVDNKRVESILKEVQDRLFTIGSTLATDPAKETSVKIPDLEEKDVALLEKEIDAMHHVLPAMKFFIMPGGHTTISTTHVARCVCRRAERKVVNMQQEGIHVEPLVIKYLNRLSDYLFVLARFLGHELKVEEVAWKARI